MTFKPFTGYASDINKDDDRQKKWKKQRKERGFDSTELWNLDVTIAKFILPRLIAFKGDDVDSHPGSVDGVMEWEEILNKMIFAFTCIDGEKMVFTDEENEAIDEGLHLFAEHFRSLWN